MAKEQHHQGPLPTQDDLQSMLVAIWRQTWPMFIGIGSVLVSNLVDAAYVSRLGETVLASYSFLFPVIMITVGIQVGFTVATGARTAHAMGQGDSQLASRLITTGLLLTFVAASVLIALVWLFKEPLFTLMGMPSELLLIATPWLTAWLITGPVMAIQYVAISQLRAIGKAPVTGRLMVLNSILNLILDPIFIFGLDMGLAGAAVATLFAAAITLILALRELTDLRLLCSLNTDDVSPLVYPLLKLASPSIVTNLLPPLAGAALVTIAAGLGVLETAAVGLMMRVEAFLLLPTLAMTTSLPVLLSHANGANRPALGRQLVKMILAIGVLVQLVIAGLVLVVQPLLASLLTPEVEVQQLVSQSLGWVPWSYSGLSLGMLAVSALGALFKPNHALVLSFIRLFVFTVPLAWFASMVGQFEGLLGGMLWANLLTGVTALLMLYWVFRGQKEAAAKNSNQGDRRSQQSSLRSSQALKAV